MIQATAWTQYIVTSIPFASRVGGPESRLILDGPGESSPVENHGPIRFSSAFQHYQAPRPEDLVDSSLAQNGRGPTKMFSLWRVAHGEWSL